MLKNRLFSKLNINMYFANLYRQFVGTYICNKSCCHLKQVAVIVQAFVCSNVLNLKDIFY